MDSQNDMPVDLDDRGSVSSYSQTGMQLANRFEDAPKKTVKLYWDSIHGTYHRDDKCPACKKHRAKRSVTWGERTIKVCRDCEKIFNKNMERMKK